MAFVTAVTQQHPWLPVVVACSPLASVREILAAGASDVVALLDREQGIDAASAQHVAFTLEKVMAQRGHDRRRQLARRRHHRSRTQGRHRQDAHDLQPRRRARAGRQAGDDRRPRPPVRRRRPVARARPRADDPRPRRLRRHARRRQARRRISTPHSSGVRTLLAPVRPDQADIVTPDFVRDVLAALRLINDVVIVDTPPGFTPAVIAAIDSSTSMCLVSMLDSLSLKNTRSPRDARADGLRPRDSSSSCSTAPTATSASRPRRRGRCSGVDPTS